MRAASALTLACAMLASCSKPEPPPGKTPAPAVPAAPAPSAVPEPEKKAVAPPAKKQDPAPSAPKDPPKPEPRVGFVKTDEATQGNWKGVYGKDGFLLIGDKENLPKFATVAAQGHQPHQFDGNPNDPRALQRAGEGRIAAAWYCNNAMDLEISLKDDRLHQLAFYLLDWDTNQRAQTVEIRRREDYKLVDMQSAKTFQKGRYLVWNVKGDLTVHISCDGGNNALLSAIFFDPPAPPK